MTAENTDFRHEALDFENPFDVKLATKFLRDLGFDYSLQNVDYSMILYNLNDQVIGTGSYQKNVLKYVVVAPEFRDTTAFAQIATHLSHHILQDNRTSFVFTRPERAVCFEGIGYKKIATAQPLITLLEMGFDSISGYQEYLKKQKAETKSNDIAALVMNCNPMTLGHKYLIEKAASENELVYLFVVEEDRSAFDFKTRWELIEQEVSALKNVVMLRGSNYVVSSSTFPSYFLKNEHIDDITKKQAELDLRVFGEYIIPTLGIKKRYVGTENYCHTTSAYNAVMKEVLPEYDVEVVEVKRKSVGEETNYISASKIREAIKQDKLNDVLDLLPQASKDFLLSQQSEIIKEKIRCSVGRH